MAGYTFRLATPADRAAVIDFMNTHWEIRHPIVNLPDFFDYYYCTEEGRLNFALAEQDGALAAIAGFTPASRRPAPDIWVSLWVAHPAHRGAGLELMAELPALTGCRTLACNNIRPNTRPFYEFLGYTTGRVGHYYRLAPKDEYAVAVVRHKDIPPVAGDAALRPLPTAGALAHSGFVPPQANPYKDLWYLSRRYFAFPRQQYAVMAVMLPGSEVPEALLVARPVPVLGTWVLRIVDYIGSAHLLPRLGAVIDGWMSQLGAEYAEWYCVGIPDDALLAAGFLPRTEKDANILPNYLDPPLRENTEYYYFTSRPEDFRLCKADGDQDRPNIHCQ